MENINKINAQNKIKLLVERFAEQETSYQSSLYNETQTRRDFIDPFFEAFGWDVDNKAGLAEQYRDVIHEARMRVQGKSKAPDYLFTLAGHPIFFVEAKKPSVNVKDEREPAYQLRRYGWSGKLALSILTDFQELAFYDCTRKPSPTDKAATARIKYLRYTDYLTEFDWLWELLSKENILKGKLDRFVQSDKNKKGTQSVDSAFLESLEEWRAYLATALASKNKSLDEDALNYVVQQTLDRLIFLRICEDRGMEDYGRLQNATKKGETYLNLFQLFREADLKYNSGIFDLKKDTLSESVKVDNKVLKTIINQMYYPESPYEFSVLPVEMLGFAYERFLGAVIRLEKTGKAVVEPKPEVRKAGGVYYTPQYIVDYIVKNTLGKLIEGKTPEQIAEIKIIDPACGSGSFLLGAYQYLLDFHTDYYKKNPDYRLKQNNIPTGKKTTSTKKKEAAAAPLTPYGHLTAAEKKRILLNNIFGVDLDAQAVEVTKLSLLLKCLEGETRAAIDRQVGIFHERALPTLDENIKAGNSLVALDFYDGQIDFEPGIEKKIKPFDWKSQFPSVFERGGFDVVVGNPPYLSTKRGFAEETYLNTYFKKAYQTATGQFDAYCLFIEAALRLLNKSQCFHSFIIPKPFLTNQNMETARLCLLNDVIDILNIADFGTPFNDAGVEAIVYIVSKNNKDIVADIQIDIFDKEGELIKKSNTSKETFKFASFHSFIINSSPENSDILNKVERNTIPLQNIIDKITRGVEAGKKDKTILNFDNGRVIKLLRGEDVARYSINWNNLYMQVDYEDKKKYKDRSLYECEEKILVRRVTNALIATLDDKSYWNLNTVYNLHTTQIDKKYLIGLLNSKLLNFWFKHKFVFEDKLFPYVRVSQLKTIPIKITVLKDLQEKVIELVALRLSLQSQIKNCQIPSELSALEARAAHTEKRIDALVYALYDLTEDEIKVIEEN